MKGKVLFCLLVSCFFVFIGCGNKVNTLNDNKGKLTNEELSDLEDGDLAAGFYLYDNKNELVPNTSTLVSQDGELHCYLEFLGVCKKDISFTLMILVNDQLQEFTVNNNDKQLFYHNRKLSYGDSDKIEINVSPKCEDIEKNNVLTYLMIYHQYEYTESDSFASFVEEEHKIILDDKCENKYSDLSKRKSNCIEYVKSTNILNKNTSIQKIGCTKENMNSEYRKIIRMKSDKIFLSLESAPGKYNSIILLDGKIANAFSGVGINEWNQKENYASVMSAELKDVDENEHSLLVMYYNVSDDKNDYNFYPLYIVKK